MTSSPSSSDSTAIGESEAQMEVKASEKEDDQSLHRRTTFSEPIERRSTARTYQEAREQAGWRTGVTHKPSREQADWRPGVTHKPSREQEFEADQARAERQIGWNGESDLENPLRWKRSYKWALVVLACLCTINATLPSAAPSAAVEIEAAALGVSVEVGQLITSLFLAGYVAGPIVWGPAKAIGRKPFFILSMVGCTAFQLGGAINSAGIAAMLVTRFFAGCCASAPLVLSGALCADLFEATERGASFCFFCISVFYGALTGPLIGGFVANSYLGFRWIYWLQMIFAGTCLVLVFLLPETYAPVLLKRRAQRLRKEDPARYGDVYAPLERVDNSLRGLLERTLFRPFKMLTTEPILIFVTLYLSIVYGLLYGLLTAIPLIFSGLYGFNDGLAGCMFLGIAIGATGFTNYFLFRKYRWLVPKWHGSPPPEQRLPGTMIGSVSFVVACFWLAWTSYASVPWYVPGLALILLGYAFSNIFIGLLTYLADTYTLYAASALAANTIVRSGSASRASVQQLMHAAAASFPLWTAQFYTRLGLQWATSFFGFLAVLCLPIPFVFYRYGDRVRGASAFAPCLDLKLREQVQIEEKEAQLLRLGDHA